MFGESPSYCEGGPPQGVQELPPTPHEDDCDIGSTSSWRQIFAVARRFGAASTSPTLGVNFMRAAQTSTTIKYSLAACRGDSAKEGSCSENATLTLGQDLRKLGLGAVVWDCVSGPFSRLRSLYPNSEMFLLYGHLKAERDKYNNVQAFRDMSFQGLTTYRLYG